MTISAVINTRNEEKNIGRCLDSVKSWTDEIVVVDMDSSDETTTIAKKYTDKIFQHEYVGYVEPARNFAISKASGEWILVIDADEEVPGELATKLCRLVEHAAFDYYRLPRKNIIFGKWVTHSGWWPDYQIRFFKKDAVTWDDEIHSIPLTQGKGMDLPAEEKNTLIHYHYVSIEQYLERLNRYTNFEAKQLSEQGVGFAWNRVITKPTGEFLSRFFIWEGYKDGLHGLVLAMLQAVSFFIVELKLWERTQFKPITDKNFLDNVMKLLSQVNKDAHYWYYNYKQRIKGISKLYYWLRAKFRI